MTAIYPHIFTPYRIGKYVLKNRIFTAPTTRHTLQDSPSAFTEGSFAYYISKAKGGAALITVGGIVMDISIKEGPGAAKYDLENVYTQRAFRNLTEAIHSYGAAATLELLYLGPQRFKREDSLKETVYGVSDDVLKNGVVTRQVSEEQLQELAEKYAQTAYLAKQCGFDGILLHSGHGMFLEQFLSPKYNKRKDQYGGSLENRARFPIMVLDKIREKAGKDFLIEYRISGSERIEGGWDIEECIEYIKMIQDKISFVHVSAGDSQTVSTRAISHPSGFLPPAPNAYLAAAVKKSGVTVPVVTIGAFQDPDKIEEVLAKGEADFVTIARGHIADPKLVKKAYEGKKDEIRPCIKCFRCLDDERTKGVFRCSVNPEIGREHILAKYGDIPEKRRKIVIAGGGPAGLVAAITAAERGHEVILYEKTDRLGGKLKFAEDVAFKYDLYHYVQYLINRVRQLPVKIRLNTEATRELLEKENPDQVIAAIGAEPVIPPIEGLEESGYLQAEQVFGLKELPGESAIVIGGGQVGCETALYLAQRGIKTILLEQGEVLAKDAVRTYRIPLLENLENAVKYVTDAKVVKINKDEVTFLKEERTNTLRAEIIVAATGYRSKYEETERLFSHEYACRIVGDALQVASVQNAVKTGYDAATTPEV